MKQGAHLLALAFVIASFFFASTKDLSAQFNPKNNPPRNPDADAAACATCCGGTMLMIVVPIVLAIVMLAVNVAILFWVAKDAKSRGMDGAMWIFLILFTGVLGLAIYLFSRTQGLLTQCENCGNNRLEVAVKCPHCGQKTNIGGNSRSSRHRREDDEDDD